ncbi:hypothetical protein THIOM_002963 [Candidatus Thiomargarita nelsonii]|uniref:Uncharacterized protein n=1 Tax=Candidatus Thiomargarita nelsonii TaxID=1003181 RepID=A0A176RZU9_9GAMM|nr:hypothetical protein THIOM_002963 [Candidatus Thiomargarita nelsonii]
MVLGIIVSCFQLSFFFQLNIFQTELRKWFKSFKMKTYPIQNDHNIIFLKITHKSPPFIPTT